MHASRLVAPAALAVALLSPSAAAEVWIVGPGPTGVDATTIDGALVLSSPGDLILVRPGFYPSAVIEEGVSLVAEPFVQVFGITVQNLPADETLRLQGLSIGFAATAGTPALDLHDNAGTVLIEKCDVSEFSVVGPRPGTTVADCAAVIVSNSELHGGEGLSIFDDKTQFVVSPGGDALRVTGDSFVALLGTLVRGGGGGNDSEGSGFSGGAAGHGLVASGGLAHVSGSRLEGGHGGWDQFSGGGHSGDGGTGLVVDGPATVRLHDSQTLAGTAGGFSPTGTSGSDGEPQSVCCGGLVVPIAGSSRLLECTSPATETAPLQITMTGEPGEAALLMVATSVAAIDLPAFDGVLVAAPGILFMPATLDGSGQGILATTAPHLPAGVEAVDLVLQAIGASGGATLSSVATLTLLGAGL